MPICTIGKKFYVLYWTVPPCFATLGGMETQIVRFAPAKLNLHLAVGPLEQNGLHSIQSLFVTASLVDVLAITLSPSESFSIAVTGLEAYCLPGEDTITKAALTYQTYRPLPFALHVHCTKRIPVQAGLGGGSSDGAAILLFLQELAGENKLGDEELLTAAKHVGSDLPFFVSGAKAAIVEGTGEVVVPLPCVSYPALVVKPVNLNISTKNAYGSLDRIMDRPLQWAIAEISLQHLKIQYQIGIKRFIMISSRHFPIFLFTGIEETYGKV